MMNVVINGMDRVVKAVRRPVTEEGRCLGRGAAFVTEERGDLVSSLGWMAVMALALVLIKGVMDGRLVGYVNTVFAHLDRVFNP